MQSDTRIWALCGLLHSQALSFQSELVREQISIDVGTSFKAKDLASSETIP